MHKKSCPECAKKRKDMAKKKVSKEKFKIGVPKKKAPKK